MREGQTAGPDAAEHEGDPLNIAELQDRGIAGLQDSMIALIDYGAGNLTSVRKAFAAIGAPVFVPRAPEDMLKASAIVVPGVGHFAATRALNDGWREAILSRVGEGRPLFGICLGMQWLFEGSDEAPDVKTFTFRSDNQTWFRYKPGQFVTLELPTADGPQRTMRMPRFWFDALIRRSGPVL